jgi:hypothetical protein
MNNKFNKLLKDILVNSTIHSYKKNYIRQNIIELKNSLKNFNLINKKLIGGENKILSINYLDEEYIFECFDDSDSEIKMYVLYSKNNEMECVVLSINKINNEASIYNLSTDGLKCSNTLITNIGTHLIKIVISLLKKYKNIFNINKLLVTDHSFLYCKKIKNNISLSDLQILKSGNTFYGKIGFIPVNKKLINKYNKNIEIINKLTVTQSNIINYLIKFQNKYEDIDIGSIIKSAHKYKDEKFIFFIKKLSTKDKFDNNCQLLNYIINKLFNYLQLTSFYNQQFIYQI